MALSIDYAAAQLMYFKLATTALADNRLAIQTRAHEMVYKLCTAPIAQSDLLWLINFDLWNVIDRASKPPEIALGQFEALLNVQAVWLRLLDHHGGKIIDGVHAPGALTLAQLF